MEIIDFSKRNSIINKYMAEMRDKNYQNNRLLFRNNIMRVGELIAYELSKTLDYEERDVQTPLSSTSSTTPATLSFRHIASMRTPLTQRWASTWNILPLPTSTTPLSSSSTRCLPPADQWRWAIRRSSPRAPRSAFTWSA